MPNKECVDRRWLIYSQLKDAAFCLCCKLYGKSSAGQLANEGCNDWKHLGGKLEKHELTPEHIIPLNAELNPICHLLALLEAHHILHVSRIRVKNIKTWLEALRRMSRNDGIDNMMLEQIKKGKLHWLQC